MNLAVVPNVLIATVTHDGSVSAEYTHTVVGLANRRDLQTTLVTLTHENLVTRGRNRLLSLFYHDFPQYDYLLFLDPDIGVSVNQLVTMILRNLDVVCAPYRLKNPSVTNVAISNILDDSMFPLVEVEYAGAGCMLLSRRLVEDVVKHATQQGWYYPDPQAPVNTERFIYDVFKIGLVPDLNAYLPEDYWFCNLIRQLGYKIYVDLSVSTTHNIGLSLPYNISMLIREGKSDAEQAQDTQQNIGA